MPAPTVRLRLIGIPAVEPGGAAAGGALANERRHQLAVRLALHRGWVTRAELAALFWPEQPSKLAYTNLRKTLFRLQAQPWAAGIESQGGALRFAPATDVHEFETALAEGRPADALALHGGGELLAGFDDGTSQAWTSWLAFERERVRMAWRGAALGLLAGEMEPAAAVALAARLLEADPLDEDALGAQLRALARSGQTAAARATYRAFAERLAAELGLEPGAELRALHDALARPSAPVPPPHAAALPAAADEGFVGRSVELQRIGELLARDDCRLVCLIGPGGAGKTRLARRAMAVLAPRYADGALFVALEDVDSAGAFAARLAQAVGAPAGKAGGDALAPVLEALGTRSRLLVLDNFEQLATQAAELLDRLRQACPGLELIVTSRVRLAARQVWSMSLEGLPCPDPEDEDRAAAFDAVRLFVQAAQRVEPGFTPAAEAAAIVDICRQVQGLPLALELAAAWVRVLPCAAIAAELRQGSELLRTPDAARPARHASIEVVFEQSWRHLTAAERRVLARLAVFRGGFTAEAARAVAGATLPVLGALADKSLLHKEGERLLLHPLVQQFAALRLADEADGGAGARAAHAAWFLRLLARHAEAVTDGRREVLALLDREGDNSREAWLHACEHGPPEALAAAVVTLADHLQHRARFDEGQLLMERAVASRFAQADAALHALLLAHLSWMAYRRARFPEAEAQARQALALERRAGGAHRALTRYAALRTLASCAFSTGQFDVARRVAPRLLVLTRRGPLARHAASTLENLSLVEKHLGHYDRALALAQQALALHRASGQAAALALSLSNLGSFHMFLDDDALAAVHLREALDIAERHGLVSTMAFALANLVELALRAGDDALARTHAERALAVVRGAGIRSLEAWLGAQLARLAARRGEPGPARVQLGAAAALALALNAPAAKAAVLLVLAEVLEAMDQGALARRVLAFGVEQESIGVPDRDEMRLEWARRAGSLTGPPDPPWPAALTLDALLERLAAAAEGGESGDGYAGLIGMLSGAA